MQQIPGASGQPPDVHGQTAVVRVDDDADPSLVARTEHFQFCPLLGVQDVPEGGQDFRHGLCRKGVLVGPSQQFVTLLAPRLQGESVHEGQAFIRVKAEHDVLYPVKRVHGGVRDAGRHRAG